MRISLINPNLVAEDAIGQCLLNQARFLQRRGDEVRLFTVYPPERMPEAITAATRVVTLADLIERRDSHFASSDVYVYHYPAWYPPLESIRGIDRGVVIFYYHNVTPPELWGSEFERESLQRSVDSVGSVIHYADLVVTDSAFNADQLAENYGCERDRIRVLPLAVPVDEFKPGPPDLDLVRQYGLEGRRVILFVGRMAGNKRIDLLVEALALVRQEVPQATLLLVGDEHSNPAIVEAVSYARQRAAALGVDDIIFTGRVASVTDHFRLAHAYATASVHEGFGVPLIEAMASGVPVVASRATAHPEVLGDAGLLAEPNNAADMARHIVSVLTDDALCGDLVRRGLARAAEFSLERYEAGWANVMAEAASWLPNQPYPRPRSALVRSGEKPAESGSRPAARLTPLELLRSETDQLEMAADVMIRGYTVRSRLPVLGPFVSWFRRNVTSHLREPYIDPMFERQVRFNRRVAQTLRQVVEQTRAGAGGEEGSSDQAAPALEARLARVEAWLGLLSAQVALLEAEQPNGQEDPRVTEVRRQIEILRAKLTDDPGNDQA